MINQILFYRIKIITNMDDYLVNSLNEVRDSFEWAPPPPRPVRESPWDELQRRKMSVKEHPFFIAIDKNDTDEVKRLIAANNGKVTSDREDRYDKCGALDDDAFDTGNLVWRDYEFLTFIIAGPLHHAKSPEMVRVLLDAGLDVNERGNMTPLISAVYRHKPEVVKALLKNGADINLCDSYGNTALHFAIQELRHGHCMTGDKEQDCKAIVDILVKNGADTTIKNKTSSKTPYEL